LLRLIDPKQGAVVCIVFNFGITSGDWARTEAGVGEEASIRFDQDAASYRLRCGSGGWAPKRAVRLNVGGGAAMLLVSRWMRRLEGVMRGILSWNKQLSLLYGV